MRYRLTLQYNGSRYSGWQLQPTGRTVQGALYDAARQVLGHDKVEIQGSGRTDAGVHALGQTAHLEAVTDMPADRMRERLNGILPQDIRILHAEAVPDSFHARHSAVLRSYVYAISQEHAVFWKDLCWHVREPLNLRAMSLAMKSLEGFADFQGYCQNPAKEKDTRVNLTLAEMEVRGGLIFLHFEGSHFLWKQVRRMTGAVVAAGRGELAPEDAGALRGSRDERIAKWGAPAQGLFLEHIYYPGDRPRNSFSTFLELNTARASR